MIKVMIVDDSAVVRNTFETIINEEPGMEVLATASDPYIAAKKLQSAVPDVIVLDIEMPRMDGLSFLRKIMKQHPIPVIICSSKTEEGSTNALNALRFGAVEIIQKPKMGTREFLIESKILLCDVIRAASKVNVKKINVGKEVRKVSKKLSADVMLQRPSETLRIDTTEKIVAIGASTGGTEALRFLFESLPVDSPGIVVVQHMPENFTRTFAERLNETCQVTVKEAKDNDPVLRGTVLIAPGNKHMMLHRKGARYSVQIKEGPLVSRHRPSVDVLFRSAARYGGKNVVGVMMTGMGDDGANGMKEMKDTGAYNIIQDEKSCVVYGMPKEAVKRGADSIILSLEKIPEAILKAATV